LEEVEERLDRLAEDEDEGGPRKGGAVGSEEEVARMVKTAVEDALLRQDRARQEEFNKWRQQLEKDMEQWRKRTEEEIKAEAGVAAASAIKGGLEECKAACKQVGEAINDLKSSQAASAGGQAGVAGAGSSAEELEEQVQKLRKAIEEMDARGDNLTERLDEMLKTSDAVDEQLSQMTGDAEVLRERISTLERGQQKVVKWQEDFVNEPPDLRDVRAKLEGLSMAVDLVKAAPAQDVGAASPAADALASQVQALTERIDLFEESTEKRLEVFQDSVQQVETRIDELEVMVKEASAHVETLKVPHASSQMCFLLICLNRGTLIMLFDLKDSQHVFVVA
jgi:chromosome segregation ATPase